MGLQSPTAVDPLAQAAMVAYCRWDPTTPVVNETVLLDGNGALSLFLPSLYVTAVTAVTVTWQDGSTYAAQIGTGLDVAWNEGGELSWLPTAMQGFGCWPEGRRNIAVTYSGGYATVPADLQAALNSLSNRMANVTSGIASKKVGTAAIAYAQTLAQGGLLLVEQMVFDRYRIVGVA